MTLLHVRVKENFLGTYGGMEKDSKQALPSANITPSLICSCLTIVMTMLMLRLYRITDEKRNHVQIRHGWYEQLTLTMLTFLVALAS